MFRIIEGLPDGALGIEASGRVTHEDYRDVLAPQVEALLTKGPVDLIYTIGDDFVGFDLDAVWDDASFGVRHWRDFRRIAVVADQQWIHAAVRMLAPFFPAEIRLFRRSELSSAKEWICQKKAA